MIDARDRQMLGLVATLAVLVATALVLLGGTLGLAAGLAWRLFTWAVGG